MKSLWRSRLSNISDNLMGRVAASLPQTVSKIQHLDLAGTYRVYDKLTGLDRVRVAHGLVAEAEESFVKSQLDRRQRQLEVFKLEEAKSKINAQLDSVTRSDESFLRLVTELHDLARQHKDAKQQLASAELAEQVCFEQFSGYLRQSQTEERMQAGRMRQWSIGFSVLAGFIAFGGTWLRFRMLEKSHANCVVSVSASIPTAKKAEHDFDLVTAELRETTLRLQQQVEKLENSMTNEPNQRRFTYWVLAVSVITAATVSLTTGVAQALFSVFRW